MEKGEMGENATGRLTTYYVAECMEFNRYGEYREDIHSAEEAVKIYQSIPSERLNAGSAAISSSRLLSLPSTLTVFPASMESSRIRS